MCHTNHLGNRWNLNQYEFFLIEDRLTYTVHRATYSVIWRRVKALILFIFKGLDYFHRKWNPTKRVELEKTDPKFNEIIQEAISKGWKCPMNFYVNSNTELKILVEDPEDLKCRSFPSQSLVSSVSQNNNSYGSPPNHPNQLTTHSTHKKKSKTAVSKGEPFFTDHSSNKYLIEKKNLLDEEINEFSKEARKLFTNSKKIVQNFLEITALQIRTNPTSSSSSSNLVIERKIQNKIDRLLKTFDFRSKKQKRIFAFLMEKGEVPPIDKKNALCYLKIAKIIDIAIYCRAIQLGISNRVLKTRVWLAFKRSTYSIRTEVLRLLSPGIKTTEVYTITLDPKKFNNPDYLKNPSNWVSERIGFYSKCVLPVEFIKMKALSERLLSQNPVSTTYVLRGPSAAGKTTWATSQFSYALDDNGELSGTVDPDRLKYLLKMRTIDPINNLNFILTNVQVHDEATKGPLSGYKVAILRDRKYCIILDARFSLIEDIDEVFKLSCRRGGIHLYDFDIPLEASLFRILESRNSLEKSACVMPDAIVKGYVEIKQSRRELINRVERLGCIQRYQLLQSCSAESNPKIVAEKEKGVFNILHREDLEECCACPSVSFIEKILNQFVRTNSWYRLALNTPPCSSNTSNSISSSSSSSNTSQFAVEVGQISQIFPVGEDIKIWVEDGHLPLAKAIEIKAIASSEKDIFTHLIREKTLLEQYGEVQREPFEGSWLSDFPQIIEHLESEHLLHVRGKDDSGRGVLWHTDKFAWKLNPQFNPEAKIEGSLRAGFQMKLGYFIIPTRSIKFFQTISQQLPQNILDQLIETEADEVKYRFFVHPAAYHHFYVLHDAAFPFIKPQESEFMSTPTSSYRSLAVRQVLEVDGQIIGKPGSLPFIVKLGVDSSSSGSRLLNEKEIKKSIEMQNLLDKVETPNSKLMVFSERLGLSLTRIESYPYSTGHCKIDTMNSGLIIREFPKQLLDGKCKIFSFSALMSSERTRKENWGLCQLGEGSRKATERLPLIFELMDIAISKEKVYHSYHFFYRYFIMIVMAALEECLFKHELCLALHGQNLSIVLDNDNIPIGVAIRDHGDTEKNSIETKMSPSRKTNLSYSWFYRYHIFIKLLNVVTDYEGEYFPTVPRPPVQIGCTQPLEERNVNYYLLNQLRQEGSIESLQAIDVIKELSIYFENRDSLLKLLDRTYIGLSELYWGEEEDQLSHDDQLFDASLNEQKIYFKMKKSFDGFTALNTTRSRFKDTLLKFAGVKSVRKRVSKEIYEAFILGSITTENFNSLRHNNRGKQRLLKHYCESVEAYSHFCEAFMKDLQPSYQSATIFAEQENVLLYVWEHCPSPFARMVSLEADLASIKLHHLVLKCSSIPRNPDTSLVCHLLYSKGNPFVYLRPLNLSRLFSGFSNKFRSMVDRRINFYSSSQSLLSHEPGSKESYTLQKETIRIRYPPSRLVSLVPEIYRNCTNTVNYSGYKLLKYIESGFCRNALGCPDEHLYIENRSSGVQVSFQSLFAFSKIIGATSFVGQKKPRIAFGSDDWKCIGNVDVEPPLPDNIDEILASPCPFWHGRTIGETHWLILIPELLNDKPLTLMNLIEVATCSGLLSTQNDNVCRHVWKLYGKQAILGSYWALITKEIVPETRELEFLMQLSLLKGCTQNGLASLKIIGAAPTLMEVVTCQLVKYVRTGIKPQTAFPEVWTFCNEEIFANTSRYASSSSASCSVDYQDEDASSHRVHVGLSSTGIHIQSQNVKQNNIGLICSWVFAQPASFKDSLDNPTDNETADWHEGIVRSGIKVYPSSSMANYFG